jgi:hypothetical protein
VELDGTGSGQYGQVSATGIIDLGAGTTLNLILGYVPGSGDVFPALLSGGSLVNTFASVPAGFVDSYTPTEMDLTRTQAGGEAVADHYSVDAPSSVAPGVAFGVTVTARDAFNNPVPGFTGRVHFTSSDGSAVLPGDYIFTAADQGVHTFPNGVTLSTLGNQTVTVAGTAFPAGLISWWPGDGNATDITGSNNGTLVGTLARYAPGLVGQAFSFCEGGDLCYFRAPTNGFPTGNSDRTLELWVKIQGFYEPEAFFAGYGNFGTLQQTYSLGASGHTLFFS